LLKRKLAFAAEISLAKARKADLEIQIKNKQDLLHVLTDRNTFTKILGQADVLNSTEHLKEISTGQDYDYIVDYFIGIKDKIDLEELRFY
jgi:hypothetical protein